MEGNKRTNWRASPSLQYNACVTCEARPAKQVGAILASDTATLFVQPDDVVLLNHTIVHVAYAPRKNRDNARVKFTQLLYRAVYM